MERIIVEDNIDWVVSFKNIGRKIPHKNFACCNDTHFKVNFAALLSAISEKMPELAYEVNVGGSKNMLDLGKIYLKDHVLSLRIRYFQFESVQFRWL